MHGLGNDFVVIDGRPGPGGPEGGGATEITPELARRICDRHFGVGADQLLWVLPSVMPGADAKMVIFNPDGTLAEMCGNGIRAVTLFLFGGAQADGRREFVIETLAGPKKVRLGRPGAVQVDMGAPVLGGGFENAGELLVLSDEDFPKRVRKWLTEREVRFFEVSMGNPHAVIFVDELEAIALEPLGRAIEVHPRFPRRTNVEFAEVVDPHTIHVRVWERGTGVTLACGTGACAVAAAAIQTGRARSPVRVGLPGGWLTIDWAGPGTPVLMEGEAEELWRGMLEPERLLRVAVPHRE